MPIVTLPLIGYAPDLDPSTPGVFSYCNGVESTTRGWKLIRDVTAPATGPTQAANSYPLQGYVSNIADGTQVIHTAHYDAATSKYKLFFLITTALTDKSRAASYSAGIEAFSFCQFGNYTIATNLTDILQIRDASGTTVFADSAATNIPKAKIAVTWGPPTAQMVMLLHYNGGSDVPNGWWNSSTGGPTASWGPDSAAGSANGTLIGAGPIRCGIAYRDDIIVFGDRQMWIGRFVGAPFVVEWNRITDEIGCVGVEAAKVINGKLYFVGDQGLFEFDGTFPRKCQFPIQQELITTLATLGTSKRLVAIVADGVGQRLQVVLRTNAYGVTQSISKWYIINLLNGRVSLRGSAVYAIDVAMDRKYSLQSSISALISGEVLLQLEATTPYAATLAENYGFGLNYLGNNKGDTKIQRVMPRFAAVPSTYKVTDYYGPTYAETLSNTNTAVTVSASPWRGDFIQSARWHAPRFAFSSNGTVDGETIDVDVEVVQSGNA